MRKLVRLAFLALAVIVLGTLPMRSRAQQFCSPGPVGHPLEPGQQSCEAEWCPFFEDCQSVCHDYCGRDAESAYFGDCGSLPGEPGLCQGFCECEPLEEG